MLQTISVLPYRLCDTLLLDELQGAQGYCVFIPTDYALVLGRGSDPAKEINNAALIRDPLPVYRRNSGGGTVVISPNTAIIAIQMCCSSMKSAGMFFQRANGEIIKFLQLHGVQNLQMLGTSDICVRNKKILGSSIYWRRTMVLYHAVLNICQSVDIIETYLAHPPKEPSYRNNRSHRDFVTSLCQEGCPCSPQAFVSAFSNYLCGSTLWENRR